MGVRDTRLGLLRSGYLQSMDTASIGDEIQAYEHLFLFLEPSIY